MRPAGQRITAAAYQTAETSPDFVCRPDVVFTDENDQLLRHPALRRQERCSGKISLPADNQTIIASKYQLYLPTKQQLLAQVQQEIDKLNQL